MTNNNHHTAVVVEPNWWRSAELQATLKKLLSYQSNLALFQEFGGHTFQMQQTSTQDSVVQLIHGIPEELPSGWDNVPLRSLILVNHSSPVTNARDGGYSEQIEVGLGIIADVRARVNTEIVDGWMIQNIRVRLFVLDPTDSPRPATPFLHQLTTWYDQLRAGLKHGQAINSITFPDQPEVAQAREAEFTSAD